jgi:hypothetical protein
MAMPGDIAMTGPPGGPTGPNLGVELIVIP